ncbi:Os01g0945001, partial [Oryza sativa Japonica Group]
IFNRVEWLNYLEKRPLGRQHSPFMLSRKRKRKEVCICLWSLLFFLEYTLLLNFTLYDWSCDWDYLQAAVLILMQKMLLTLLLPKPLV